jgi:glucose-6-phosphate 1-dehydrogenase
MFEGFRPFDKLRVTITHPPAKAVPLFLEGSKKISRKCTNIAVRTQTDRK